MRQGRIRQAVEAARAVTAGDRAWAIGYAVLNWLLDLICLVAVAQACGVPLSWSRTATIYLGVQLVRQVPLTPGGIGLIEAGLLAGLLAAGTPETAAAAVVLGYRLLSFWLVIPIGGAAYLGLGRRNSRRRR
ncbi:YbhN family protein [Actinoplanes sp. NBC_00393]|uniref:lysylphosphatidylglycerol synthase transmembrane domain-containing protein n=1 Tax=Actinoplanes sp. NBC_00393 TaxID=2975953 RepID=UPI002E232276